VSDGLQDRGDVAARRAEVLGGVKQLFQHLHWDVCRGDREQGRALGSWKGFYEVTQRRTTDDKMYAVILYVRAQETVQQKGEERE